MLCKSKPIFLQELYAQIPSIDCKGCGQCCGPIEMSPVEKQIITDYCSAHDIPLGNLFASMYEKWVAGQAGEWQCPMRQNGVCVIYTVRPVICRLQGCTPRLPCPHFPNRKYGLGVSEARRLAELSWRLKR
jgi:hypothetical protein